MLKTYLFALIVGVQAIFGLNATVEFVDNPVDLSSRPVAETIVSREDYALAKRQEDYLLKLTEMGIKLHPGTDFAKDSVDNPVQMKQCASLVYRTLSVMPPETVKKLKNLTLYFNSTGRRGLGGGSTIILRCQNVSDKELVSVLVHELGHIQDTGVLSGASWTGNSEFVDGQAPVFMNDLSLDFYRISFNDEASLKTTAVPEDFVSGYAMSDPFEDFAETYNYYLLHGDHFRLMLDESEALRSKYQFMKDVVFADQEFDYQTDQIHKITGARNYDATQVGYNLNNFLANV